MTTLNAELAEHAENPRSLSAGSAVSALNVIAEGLRVIMRIMTRAAFAVFMSAFVFVAMTAAAAPQSSSTTAQDRFPETTGKGALLKVCGNCHTADSVVQSLKTRQEWSDVIDQMAHFGAEASEQEFDQILTYLVKHFSPIKVNKATANDLEATLDVSAGVADAIVNRRTDNGDFKTVDDLKQVPGLEAGKINAQKARIVF
jgi:competence protein ComEA